MILGETARDNDMEVNPIKEKKLTNVRVMGEDDAMLLIPPRKMSLEQAIAHVEDDEPVEVTPFAIPQRKRFLDPNQRKRNEPKTDAEAAAQPVISSSAWSGTA
jgi:GTP-binding protein